MFHICDLKIKSLVALLLLVSIIFNIYCLYINISKNDDPGLCELQRKYAAQQEDDPPDEEGKTVFTKDNLKNLFDKFGSDKGFNHGYHR